MSFHLADGDHGRLGVVCRRLAQDVTAHGRSWLPATYSLFRRGGQIAPDDFQLAIRSLEFHVTSQAREFARGHLPEALERVRKANARLDPELVEVALERHRARAKLSS